LVSYVSYGTKNSNCYHNHAICLWLCLIRCFFDLSTSKHFGPLTVPPKVATPWFHLIHGYIPTAALQHAWNLSVATSTLCRLCQQDVETHHHLFVSCSFKLNFWSIFERYSLPDKFLTADEIWSVLTSFVSVDEQTTVDTGVLCFFDAGIATIWKYHWRYVFDDIPWYTTAAVNSFDLEHSGFLSTLCFERKLSSIIDT
jgi:hypothetical protein